MSLSLQQSMPGVSAGQFDDFHLINQNLQKLSDKLHCLGIFFLHNTKHNRHTCAANQEAIRVIGMRYPRRQ